MTVVEQSAAMSLFKALTRPSFKKYTVFLCFFYLGTVFLFHSRLQFRGVSVAQDVEELVAEDEADITKTTPPPSPFRQPPLVAHLKPPKVVPVIENSNGLLKANATNREIADSKAPQHPEPEDNRKTGARSIKGDRFNKCNGPKAEQEFSFQSVVPGVSIFSGYWDDRPNDFDNRYDGVKIRLMTIVKGKRFRPPLKCFFDVDGKDIPVLVTYYEMCENHNRQMGGYILSCDVPAEIQNTSVCSVRVSGDVQLSSGSKVVTVPVYDTRQQNHRYKFSMCVPPIFGNVSQAKLVEFMELSSILGAEQVMFYNFSVSASVSRVLQYYVSRGRAAVTPWPLPAAVDSGMWYHGQLVAVEDCLYRHMGQADFLTFNDIDEFMLPRTAHTWSEMLSPVDSDNICGFKFSSAFFDPKVTPLKPLAEKTVQILSLGISQNMRQTVLSRIRTKCMVKPRSIFEMGIHHISKPILASLQGKDMNPGQAILHHYRSCLPGFGMKCKETRQDDSALRYSEELYKRVLQVHKDLRGPDKNG